LLGIVAKCPGCICTPVVAPNSLVISAYSVVAKTPWRSCCPGVIGVMGGTLTDTISPLSEIVGEMVMPPIELVKGARDAAECCRECVPLVVAETGEVTGEPDPVWSSPPTIGVMPNAEAARLVGRLRREIPPWLVLERTSCTGRRGDGELPW